MTIEKLLEYVKQESVKNIKLCHIIKESYLEDTFIKKCVILSRYKSYINGYKCGNKDNNIDDLNEFNKYFEVGYKEDNYIDYNNWFNKFIEKIKEENNEYTTNKKENR